MKYQFRLAKTCLFVVFILCLTGSLHAQRKFMMSRAEMNFKSDAELEVIQASSKNVQGIIDPATNQFAFTVEVKSFQGFNSALQREHFNEKYMESERYPRARFSGKIVEPIDVTVDGEYDIRVKGELDIHGIKQTRIIKTKVTVRSGIMQIESVFFVPLADHNISIPSIVSQKIASEIEVEFRATMSLQSL